MPYVTINFPATASLPMIWINTPQPIWFVGLLQDANGNYNAFKILPGCNVPGFTFNWVVTTPAAGTSSDTYGLRVFKPDGSVVFDSGLDYLKVRDAVPFALNGTSNTFTTVDTTLHTVNHASVATPYYLASAIIGTANQYNPNSHIGFGNAMMFWNTSPTTGNIQLQDLSSYFGQTSYVAVVAKSSLVVASF